MDAQRLFRLTKPHLHLWVATSAEACDLARSLERSPERRAIVRILRGSKGRTAAALFDEFAAALQFPHYFGENWDALDECLNDLEWLPGDAYVLLFTESRHLLDQDSHGQLALLLQILEGTAEAWAHPQKRGAEGPPRPFHVVFQCGRDNEPILTGRLKELGHSLDRLEEAC